MPDFDDWFDAVERLSAESKIQINTKTLPVEGSRGCWWGQRQHCVFCGIDEETLKYRHKEADRFRHARGFAGALRGLYF